MQAFRFLLLAGAFLLAPAVAQGKDKQRALDPCSLITKSEIRAVQGEEVVATKSSQPERRDFAVSQCFYTVATFAKSVSLEVTRRATDKGAGRSPREDWMKLFHPETKESEAERKAGKEEGRPQPVADLGDEAFWSSDGVVGALYVLKGDAYFRISIGGAEEQSARLEKSGTLAGKALRRL